MRTLGRFHLRQTVLVATRFLGRTAPLTTLARSTRQNSQSFVQFGIRLRDGCLVYQNVYQKWYSAPDVTPPPAPHLPEPVLDVRFFRTAAGNEPVRDWLKGLDRLARRAIGEDIKTAQFGWPLGMPLIRKIGKDLWEFRTTLEDGIARVLFTVADERMYLLHGFIKKSQKTPENELRTARRRLSQLKKEER